MLEQDENQLDTELLNAIENQDSTSVLLLLKQGANPNAIDQERSSCLTIAISVTDEPTGCDIVQHLLDYGADPFGNADENDFPLEETEGKAHEFFTTIINFIIKTNNCHKISLNQIAYWQPALASIIEHGAYEEAGNSLYDAIDLFKVDKDAAIFDDEDKSYIYNNIKQLYLISKANNIIMSVLLREDQVKFLILLALSHNDFKFSLTIINDTLRRFSLLDESFSNDPPLSILLFREVKECDSDHLYRKALTFLTLSLNFVCFYKTIIKRENDYNTINSDTLSINKKLLYFAYDANTILQNCIMAFLNPKSERFPNNLPLNLRLKITLTRLHDDLPYIKLINADLINNFLLYRMLDYQNNYHARVSAYFIFKPKMLNILNSIEDNLINIIYNTLREFELVFNASKNYLYLKSMIRHLISKSDNLNKNLPGIINSIKNYLIYFGIKPKLIIRESQVNTLGLAILSRDNGLLNITFNSLTSDNIKQLGSLDELFNTKDSCIFSRNLFKSIDYDWLNERALIYGINYANVNLVMNVIEHIQIENKYIILAIKLGNSHILELILQNILQRLSKRQFCLNLVECTFDKNIIASLFQNYNEDTFRLTFNYFESFLLLIANDNLSDENKKHILGFFTFLIRSIIHNKYFHLLQNVVTLGDAINIPIQSLILQIIPMISSYKLKQDLLDNLSPVKKEQIVADISLQNTLKKILLIKIANHTFSRYIARKEMTTNNNGFLNKLSSANYSHLLKKLKYPDDNMSTSASNHIIPLLGNPHSNKVDQILTKEEKIIYLTLMNANWKLTHLVSDINALSKILSDKEIRSPLYQKNLMKARVKQSTPDILDQGGYIFATLGPEKSPIPNFLNKASGIEIDVNNLLKIYPHFFDKAIISGHWYAFEANQAQSTLQFSDCTIHTYHFDFVQYNEFYTGDTRYNTFKSFSETIFTGNNLIHTLCLKFIQNIRSHSWLFYQDVVNHSQDIEFLTKAFAFIMHPGICEMRYPHSIPLCEKYYKIIDLKNHKVETKIDPQRALDDIHYYRDCVNHGFDPNAAIFLIPMADVMLFGNILALAIVKQKIELIDELMTNYPIELVSRKNCIISPLTAAISVKDYGTIFKLLTHGVPANSYGFGRILNTLPHSDLVSFLKNINIEQCHKLFSCLPESQLMQILNSLCFDLNTQNIEQQESSILCLEALLQIPFRELPTFPIQTPLRLSIQAKCKKAITLFVKYDKTYNITTDIINLLFENNLNDIVTDLLTAHYTATPSGSKLPFLMALLAGFNDYFNYFLHFFYSKNSELVELQVLIDDIYRDEGDEFLKLLHNYNENKPKWVQDQYFVFVKNAAIQLKYIPYVETSKFQFIELQLEQQNVPQVFLQQIMYIKDNLPLDYLYIFELYTNHSAMDDNQLQCLLEVVQDTPFIYVHFLDEFSHFKPCYLHYDFILCNLSYLTQSYKIKNLLQKYLSNEFLIGPLLQFSDDPHQATCIFVHWLLLMLDHHFGNPPIIHLPIVSKFVEQYYLSIQQYCESLSDISMKLRYHLQIALHTINGFFALPETKAQIGFNNISSTSDMQIDQANLQLIKKKSVVGFITCHVNGQLQVYLGNKLFYGHKLPYLLAPGGFLRNNESVLDGLIREIFEETCLNLDEFDFINDDHYVQLKTFGFVSIKIANDVSVDIAYRYKYKKIDSLNAQNEQRQRIIYFLSMHIPFNFYSKLKAGDDFANGQWIPCNAIKYDVISGKYFYQNTEILASNAMLLQEIQGTYIGKITIDEALEKEIAENYKLAHKIHANSSSFFANYKNNKRGLDSIIEPEHMIKRQKHN